MQNFSYFSKGMLCSTSIRMKPKFGMRMKKSGLCTWSFFSAGENVSMPWLIYQ